MIKELIKMAGELDRLGLRKEADKIDTMISKLSSQYAYDGELRDEVDQESQYQERHDAKLHPVEDPSGRFIIIKDRDGDYTIYDTSTGHPIQSTGDNLQYTNKLMSEYIANPKFPDLVNREFAMETEEHFRPKSRAEKNEYNRMKRYSDNE